MTMVTKKMQTLGGMHWLGAQKPESMTGHAGGEADSGAEEEQPPSVALDLPDDYKPSYKESERTQLLTNGSVVQKISAQEFMAKEVEEGVVTLGVVRTMPDDGSLHVAVERARDLKDVAGATERMDPYAELVYGLHTNLECTKSTRKRRHGGRTPVWRSKFKFPVHKKGTSLTLNVYHKNFSGQDFFIGRSTVDLQPILTSTANDEIEVWTTLHEKRDDSTYHGQVLLRIRYGQEGEAGEGCNAKLKAAVRFLADLGPKLWESMKSNHPWLSCIFVAPDDGFTRPQRTSVLMAIIFGNLCISAILFDSPPCTPDMEGYPDCANTIPCTPDMEGYPNCPVDKEDVEEEETNWKQFFSTIVIISVILLPCDRVFIAMFEKMERIKQSELGRGPGGRIWDLPEVSSDDVGLAKKAQALMRGFLTRRKAARAKRKREMIETMHGNFLAPPRAGELAVKVRQRAYPKFLPKLDVDNDFEGTLPGQAIQIRGESPLLLADWKPGGLKPAPRPGSSAMHDYEMTGQYTV
jgi:hypothetical protein